MMTLLEKKELAALFHWCVIGVLSFMVCLLSLLVSQVGYDL